VAIAAEWDVIAIDPQQPLPVSARISPGDWETHGADFDRLVHTVVVGEQSVFVVRRNCAVQIDPKLGDVRNRLCPGRDIAVGFDRMWFTFADVVRGADLYTGEELEPIQVRDPSTFTEALSGGGERIATGLGSVWVGYRDGILSRLDVGSGEVTTRRIGEAIDSMAVGGGAVWLGDRFDGSLAILDVETGSIERIDLGAVTPDELVYDEASQKAWALDVFSDLVVAIDRDGASQTVPVGADPTDIAVGIDRVWVTDLDGILREVNPTTGRVREVLDVGLPLWAVGVDEETALVWLDVSPPPRREFA
jgi:streptogramin lyase